MAWLVKKGEFAALQGVGASAVSNWAKRNLLVLGDDPDRPGKKLVDVEKSRLLIQGTIDPTLGRPKKTEVQQAAAPQGQSSAPAPIALNGMEAARLEEMRERTLGRRRENEAAYGTLVLRAEAERRAGELGRLTRERTYGLIRQLAERLAAETDPRQITALLTDEFDRMFSGLADDIEADAKAEAVADAALATAEAAEEPIEPDGEASEA